jgi:hypothetical protein
VCEEVGISTPASGPRAHVPGEDGPGGLVGEVASSDRVAVRYAVYGDGVPAVVFVHGWSCDRS